MAIQHWRASWDAIQKACEYREATGRWAKGLGEPPRFEIAPPASEQEVRAIEAELGCPIPASLRHVLLNFSSATCIEWALPQDTKMPPPFRQIFAGECRWDLQSLPELQTTYQTCLEMFPNPDDFWDGPWQNKFPILEVGNGDMVVIDLAAPQAVVYLSHEGDDSLHGYWLGSDFEDYVDRLSHLGCIGSEDWQLKPFVSGPRSLLETDSEVAKQWRDWFGLRLRVSDE